MGGPQLPRSSKCLSSLLPRMGRGLGTSQRATGPGAVLALGITSQYSVSGLADQPVGNGAGAQPSSAQQTG